MAPADSSSTPPPPPQEHHPPQGHHPPPPPPPQIVIQSSSSLLFRIIAGIGWLGLLLCVPIILGQAITYSEYYNSSGGVIEKYHSQSKTGTDKIAVINVKGVIMSGEGYVGHQIKLARADENVKAIVVRVDSPGGTVTGSDFILHHLNKLREEKEVPIVVSMGSMAASGGYYVAMAVGDEKDTIFAEPTTTTGSIGVIIPHYGISGLMEKYDIADDSIMSHPRKQMLSMTRAMPAEHRDILQNYVNEAFGRFKDIVKDGRPAFKADPAKLDVLATGEIFTANQALKSGLVDKIGFVDDAIKRAAELASLDVEKTRVVTYEQPTSLFSIASMSQQKPGVSLETVLEMTAPKAYYLSSYVPPVIKNIRLD